MIPLRDVIPARTTPVVTLALLGLNAVLFLWRAMAGAMPFPWLHTVTDLVWLAGWTSLIGNLLVLGLFGENVEDRLGHLRFLTLYVVCGTVGGWTHEWLMPASLGPGPGAPAAVAGVVGAYLWQFPRSRVLVLIWPGHTTEVPALVFLGVWLLLTLAGGQASWGLIAGFIAGVVLGWLAARPERARVEWYEGG